MSCVLAPMVVSSVRWRTRGAVMQAGDPAVGLVARMLPCMSIALLLDRLEGDVDRHLVAEHRAGLDGLVVGDAEVLPVDRRRGREGRAALAPGILEGAR